jgi:prepilin-type N-terminal cleavage/methylation domain-containing protein
MDLESIMKIKFPSRLPQSGQSGFSLLEVMISMFILTTGLLAVLSVFGVAIAANASSQQDMIARQVASEAMESIFTARNSSQLTFSQIQNVPSGIFAAGAQTLMCGGPTYGIVGVSGDTASCLTRTGAVCPNGGVECLTEPGPDGILGTADDVILSLNNYTRTIAITPLSSVGNDLGPTLIQVVVTVTYNVPNSPAMKTYTLEEYISSYH